MEKLIELNTNPNILVSSNLINIKHPEYIHIPILPNSKILVKASTKVKIGTPVISTNNNIYTSSISGVVTTIKKVRTINGEVDAIEIKNDFEEQTIKETKVKKNILNIKKEVLDKALNLFKIDLIGQKNLILNCIDDEPYTLTESFYLLLNYSEFLEVLDKLSDIYNLKIAIAVKASNNYSINELMNYLGMYPNIKLEILPNLYLLGKEKFLLKHLGLEISETKVISASLFYHLSNFLKKGRLKSEQLLTISGDNVRNPSIIKVKIGSEVKTILKDLNIITKDYICIGNGLMSGKIISLENLIITEDLTSILIMREDNKTKKEGKCLNCGACLDICPVGINPILLKNAKYYNNVKDQCLRCGLCSYICPVYINFNNDIRKGDTSD